MCSKENELFWMENPFMRFDSRVRCRLSTCRVEEMTIMRYLDGRNTYRKITFPNDCDRSLYELFQ